MHDPGLGKRITLHKVCKAVPGHAASLRPPVEPLLPPLSHAIPKVLQPLSVPRHPIIRIMAPQLLDKLLMLPRHRGMASAATPGVDPLQGTTQTPWSGLALDHPVPPSGAAPVMSASQQVKGLGG